MDLERNTNIAILPMLARQDHQPMENFDVDHSDSVRLEIVHHAEIPFIRE